jgi:hypothetical protein
MFPAMHSRKVVLIAVVSANKLQNMKMERGNTVAGTLAQCTAVAAAATAAASTLLQQELLLLLLLSTPGHKDVSLLSAVCHARSACVVSCQSLDSTAAIRHVPKHSEMVASAVFTHA